MIRKLYNDQERPINYLLCMFTIFVASSLLFLDGFFQVSNNQFEKSEKQFFDNIRVDMLDNYTRLQSPEAIYDQIIFMVIDAWRADFPNATNMPYIHENACEHLKIKVDTPTVTMPRIKTVTTGSISNFIDIVFNLGHTTKLDESIFHRMAQKNKKMVFAGDVTWVQLFPDKFKRAAVNTDSFFVNDFYEGDLNVTKTLKEELKLNDWNLLVLHYLGLDHIGHVEGSHSEKIFVKLIEMDNIIKYIGANMYLRSLLLITGDHGMRNGGSHGGSEMEELYVPLMAFSNNCVKKRAYFEYNQIDLAATLAVLLDVNIPKTSIGCLIPEMLTRFSKEEQLYFFHYNTLHLMEKLKFSLENVSNEDILTWYKDAKTSHKEYILSQATSNVLFEKAKQNYVRLSKKISQILSESKVQYNMLQILIALFLATLCAIKLLMNILFDIPSLLDPYKYSWKTFFACLPPACFIYFLACSYDNLVINNVISSIILICAIAMSIYFSLDILKIFLVIIIPPFKHNRKIMLKLSIPSVLLFFFSCHSLSLVSSSFIEEEHQTWYYFTSSLLLFLILQNFYINVKIVLQNLKTVNALLTEFWNIRYACVVMMSLIGCRRLNQTGDKWRHIVDIGDVLARSENHLYLMLTLITGLTLLFLLLRNYNSPLETCFCFLSLFCVFLYRQVDNYSFLVFILFWASLFFTQLRYWRVLFLKRKNFGYLTKGNLVGLLEAKLTCCVLISALMHRSHNVILLPAMIYTLEKSYLLCDNLHIKDKRIYSRCYVLVWKTGITIFIANSFYFFQGNSNSLATIDLNPGYIGLTSYNPFIVGPLITINTYCSPINAFLYLMLHMLSTHKKTLPMRQEKEQVTNAQLLESTDEDLHLVYSLFTISTIMPVTVYWCLLVGFRYHLFIYSVFAPKAFYGCFQLLVFYFNFILTNFYFRLF